MYYIPPLDLLDFVSLSLLSVIYSLTRPCASHGGGGGGLHAMESQREKLEGGWGDMNVMFPRGGREGRG